MDLRRIEKEELEEDRAAIRHYEKFEKESPIPLEEVAEELSMFPTDSES